MKRAALSLLFFFAASGSLACPPPSVRVGLVDGSRVVRISKRGKKIRTDIQREGERLTQKLELIQKKAKRLASEAEALAKKLPENDPKRAAAQRAQQRAERELRETHLRYRKQLNQYGQRLLDEFKEVVRRVAMEIRKRQGLDLVVMTSRGDQSGLWFWPVVDITDQVVQLMDGEQ